MNRPGLPRERSSEEQVRAYYDNNTRRFLRLGGSAHAGSIHRAVYGPGVLSRQEALSYSNLLILRHLEQLVPASLSVEPIHVLDMGCGVGGSLFYIAQHLSGERAECLRCTGVTLSPVQTQIAQESARRLGLAEACTFYTASYLELPPTPQVDLAFAIESFVLGPNPAAFFASASAALCPGGRLVIIDDFLSAAAYQHEIHPDQSRWIRDFERGWHAGSLLTVAQSVTLARRAGLQLRADRNWTNSLRLNDHRNRLVKWLVTLGAVLPLRLLLGNSYWESLVGGNALHQGILRGVFQYHELSFEKPTT